MQKNSIACANERIPRRARKSAFLGDLHENEPEWNIRTEHEGMFTEMGIKIKALIARKKPGDDSVTWIEPKVLKRMAREAAEAEAAAKAAQEGESNV